MCGIVGIAGDLFSKEEKTMQGLLLADYFRGTDSTGLAAVRNTGEVHIAKLASDPITLFQMSKFKTALSATNSKLFLGHNRASTSGSTNHYNAHPVECGNIIGVQNGTLECQDKTMLEDVVGEKFDVDTQALFTAIDKIGIKDTIEMLTEGTDSLRGAWSLVWYDKTDDTLNFLRNKHRPMWMCWDKGFKRLFFASMYQTIRYVNEVVATPAYEFEQYEKKDEKGSFYTYFQVPVDTHLKFNLSEMMKGSKELPKPLGKIIRGKEPKKAVSYKSPTWDPFPGLGSHVQKSSGIVSSTTTSLRGSDRQGKGIFHTYSKDDYPYSNILGLARFSELVQMGSCGKQTGCSWCLKPIKYGDTGITVYEEQDTILCAKCSGNEGDDTAPALKVYVSPDHYRQLEQKAA